MAFQRVCNISELAVGEAIAAVLLDADGEDKAIAIIRDTSGDVHAISQLCTHGDIPLDEGEISDCAVECWAHGAAFDLETGEATLPATMPVAVYPVEIKDGQVAVDVDNVKN